MTADNARLAAHDPPAGARRGSDTQDEASVGAAYNAIADTYADRLRDTEAEQPVELAMVAHFASLVPGARLVLDAGCGAGRLLPVLARFDCRVRGVDLSPEMIRRARRDHPSFDARVGSLTDLPLEDASVDGVFSWYSTIHSPDADLPRIATELRRILRRGGVALLAFQSGSGTRDLSAAYRALGHDVVLERYNRTAAEMAAVFAAEALTEVARLERRPVGSHEQDAQAVLILQG